MPQQKPSGKQMPEVLPILSLEDIVIYPGMIAPLVLNRLKVFS
jgi:ATP-dependent Lon protease